MTEWHQRYQAAAGAVGGIAVQLARHAGATVDALVSRPEHLATARELGAKDVWRTPADLPRRRRTPSIIEAALEAEQDFSASRCRPISAPHANKSSRRGA